MDPQKWSDRNSQTKELKAPPTIHPSEFLLFHLTLITVNVLFYIAWRETSRTKMPLKEPVMDWTEINLITHYETIVFSKECHHHFVKK